MPMDEERDTVMTDLGYNHQSTKATIYPLRKNGKEVYRNSESLPEGLVRIEFITGPLSGETKVYAERFADEMINRNKAIRSKDQTKHIY